MSTYISEKKNKTQKQSVKVLDFQILGYWCCWPFHFCFIHFSFLLVTAETNKIFITKTQIVNYLISVSTNTIFLRHYLIFGRFLSKWYTENKESMILLSCCKKGFFTYWETKVGIKSLWKQSAIGASIQKNRAAHAALTTNQSVLVYLTKPAVIHSNDFRRNFILM